MAKAVLRLKNMRQAYFKKLFGSPNYINITYGVRKVINKKKAIFDKNYKRKRNVWYSRVFYSDQTIVNYFHMVQRSSGRTDMILFKNTISKTSLR